MSTILLIGKNGQLGQELPPLLQPLGELIAVGREDLDLTKPEQITSLLEQTRPQIIINTAAYTAVDKAEQEPDLARQINQDAVLTLAETAQTISAFLVHLSTDYVFDGKKTNPYLESDPPNPLNIYGKSKLGGEQAIQSTKGRSLILRTSWVYGIYGKQNFVKTMLRLAQTKPELKVVQDQIGSPTWSQDLAQVIARLIQIPELPPILHYANKGVVSWYDFAQAIFTLTDQSPKLIPIPTSDYPTPAQRPLYSVLNTEKITKLSGFPPPQWDDSLAKMLSGLTE